MWQLLERLRKRKERPKWKLPTSPHWHFLWRGGGGTFNDFLQPAQSYGGNVFGTGSVFSTRTLTRLSPEPRGGRPSWLISWLGFRVSVVRADGRADLPEHYFILFFSQKEVAVLVSRNKRSSAGGHESTVALMGGAIWLTCSSLFRSDTTPSEIHNVFCVSPVFVFLSTTSSFKVYPAASAMANTNAWKEVFKCT